MITFKPAVGIPFLNSSPFPRRKEESSFFFGFPFIDWPPLFYQPITPLRNGNHHQYPDTIQTSQTIDLIFINAETIWQIKSTQILDLYNS